MLFRRFSARGAHSARDAPPTIPKFRRGIYFRIGPFVWHSIVIPSAMVVILNGWFEMKSFFFVSIPRTCPAPSSVSDVEYQMASLLGYAHQRSEGRSLGSGRPHSGDKGCLWQKH